jgi:hypothetical protein
MPCSASTVEVAVEGSSSWHGPWHVGALARVHRTQPQERLDHTMRHADGEPHSARLGKHVDGPELPFTLGRLGGCSGLRLAYVPFPSVRKGLGWRHDGAHGAADLLLIMVATRAVVGSGVRLLAVLVVGGVEAHRALDLDWVEHRLVVVRLVVKQGAVETIAWHTLPARVDTNVLRRRWHGRRLG